MELIFKTYKEIRIAGKKWEKDDSCYFSPTKTEYSHINPYSEMASQLLLLLLVGFNMCPFQLLRSYKRHEENKRKIGQERSSMQQADYHRHRPTP